MSGDLGETIRRIRKAHGWTQAELARRLGCQQNNVARYECGRIVPGLAVLTRLFAVLEESEDRAQIGAAIGRLLAGPASQTSETYIRVATPVVSPDAMARFEGLVAAARGEG